MSTFGGGLSAEGAAAVGKTGDGGGFSGKCVCDAASMELKLRTDHWMTSVVNISINPCVDRSPYYIVAPRYVRTSAGIRCLHLLCHWLNRRGENASLAIINAEGGLMTGPDLLTPVLDVEKVERHFAHGRRPIVVYPEVVAGNPLNAECVVRWVLNFPGLLGGDLTYPPSEMIMAFSGVLAKAVGPDIPVLHMPVLNEDVFRPDLPRPRSGAAFYASKYQNVHDGKIFGVPHGAIEITRDRPDSQSPKEIAEILHSVEVLYVFENTALATEAVLCGCPVVFMPNPWLDKPIAAEELGWDGMAWGDDPAEVARARATVEQGRLNYRRTVLAFHEQLDAFIERTQAQAALGLYERKVDTRSIVLPTGLLRDDLPIYLARDANLATGQLVKLIKAKREMSWSDWLSLNHAVASTWWRYRVRDPLRRWRRARRKRIN